MAIYDGITEFVKSGPRRLRDAEELLQSPTFQPSEQGAQTRHLRGAMYLAGYGVECLLKAYIISRQQPCVRLSEARDAIRRNGRDVRDICGPAGHDLPYLLSLTDLEVRMDLPTRQQMGLCAKWNSSWRYHPGRAETEEAQAFVAAARKLVNWIRSQI